MFWYIGHVGNLIFGLVNTISALLEVLQHALIGSDIILF